MPPMLTGGIQQAEKIKHVKYSDQVNQEKKAKENTPEAFIRLNKVLRNNRPFERVLDIR